MRRIALLVSITTLGCGVVTRSLVDGTTDTPADRSPAGERHTIDRVISDQRRDMTPGDVRTDARRDAAPADTRFDVVDQQPKLEVAVDQGAKTEGVITPDAKPGPDGGVPVPYVVGKAGTTDAHAVVIAGSYAYVADGDGGLAIIDITSAVTPKACPAVATFDAQDVAVGGGTAYVADAAGGLKVVDVSSPCAAKAVAPGLSTTVGSPFQRVTLSGSNLFVLTYAELVVVDVSAPKSPSQITSKFLGGFYSAAAPIGTHLLLAGGDLVAVNVSTPGSPTIVGSPLSAPCAPCGGIVATGAIPSVSTAAVAVGLSGIVVADASNPAQLKQLGAKSSVNETGVALRVSGGKVIAYVTTHYSKLERWNLTDPAQPTRILPDLPLSYGCSGIALGGTHAYLACGTNGLVVLDGVAP